MARVKGGTVARARRKKVLKLAKGYFGSKHLLYRTANEQVMRSLRYSYIGRKQLKRNMRKLWIARINAAARMHDISYSKLMHGLTLAGVTVNRKMLSEIAIHDEKGFASIVETAKKALVKGPAAKVVAEAVVEEVAVEAEEVKKPAKKTTKKAASEETTEEKPAKKTAAKKTTKKVAEEGETAEKKPAAKKRTTKKAEEPAAE